MSSSFIEFIGVMFLCGMWVFTLALIADALLGLPYGLFAREDPEGEALRSKLLTPKVLKLRMIVAPVLVVVPTLALTFAVTRLAPESVNDGALQWLWTLTLLYVGLFVYTSVERLWPIRRRRKDRQE